jgi:hypothetical protein
MQVFSFSIILEKVNNQIQITTSSTIPSGGLGPGEGVELTVTALAPLSEPTIHTIQFFASDDGQPAVLEAIWARIGQTEGIFTTSSLIFAAMQSAAAVTSATFTNINVAELPQDAFFACGGLVKEAGSTHSWFLDPEVILRSGEWPPGQ